jgi:hypothetical protein
MMKNKTENKFGFFSGPWLKPHLICEAPLPYKNCNKDNEVHL